MVAHACDPVLETVCVDLSPLSRLETPPQPACLCVNDPGNALDRCSCFQLSLTLHSLRSCDSACEGLITSGVPLCSGVRKAGERKGSLQLCSSLEALTKPLWRLQQVAPRSAVAEGLPVSTVLEEKLGSRETQTLPGLGDSHHETTCGDNSANSADRSG